jgi:hypothetical protein
MRQNIIAGGNDRAKLLTSWPRSKREEEGVEVPGFSPSSHPQ